MRPAILPLVACALASCSALPALQDAAAAAPASGYNVALEVGGAYRVMDDDEWSEDADDLDQQTVFGANVAVLIPESPVEVVFGYQNGQAEGEIESFFGDLDTEVTFEELSLGIRYLFFDPRAESAGGYLGLGVSSINAELDVEGSKADDSVFGGYVSGGFLVNIGAVRLGLDLRVMAGGELEDADVSAQPGYTQLGAFVGVLL